MNASRSRSGVLLGALLIGLTGGLWSRGAEAQEVDPLELAATLLRDGFVDRAVSVLATVVLPGPDVPGLDPPLDPAAPVVDQPRYYTLVGIAASRQARYDDADAALTQAMTLGVREPSLRLMLARARFELGAYDGALAVLGPDLDVEVSAHLIALQCHWRSGDRGAAWTAVRHARSMHPDHREVARQEVMLLVDLGLYGHAADAGREYLHRFGGGSDDYVAVAEALRGGGSWSLAATFLEEARLRFPDEKRLGVQLARTYADAGRHHAAAGILADLSLQYPELAQEAAELYRRAGRYRRALMVNARVMDQAAKIRQRLGLLVELEQFDSAVALDTRLSRLGLLDEDAIKYALGYAYFRVGRYAQADSALRGIRDREVFQRAAELRRAVLACQAPGAQCNH